MQRRLLSGRLLLSLSAAAVAGWGAGCSEGRGGGGFYSDPDAAAMDTPDLAAMPDMAPPPPAEPPMESQGGPTLAVPNVYTVVWTGDEATGKQLDQFHKDMLKSDYWTKSMMEYGVGAGTGAGVLVVKGPVPASLGSASFEATIRQLLLTKQLPTPDENTVVMFLVPSTINMVDGSSLADDCVKRLGYHTEMQSAPGLPYIVVLPCTPADGQTVLDELTGTESHEIAEVSSDPHPNSNPAWQNPWLGGLGEVGDMCNDVYYSLTVPSLGGAMATYQVTHIYSGVAAMTPGTDPCLPARPGPYWNVGVDPSNIVINTDAQGTGMTTVKIIPFSYGTPQKLHWYAYTTPNVTIHPASGVSKPGDVVTVTLSTTRGPARSATWFTILVTDPNKPALWGQEWIGALTVN